MVAKTAAAKRKTTAKKTTAKSSAKKTTAKSTAVKKPAQGRPGPNREVNDETGFVSGTDQDTIALALLEGGDSRAAIAEKLEKKIGGETRNGTPKQVTNMTSGVLNKMLAQGYVVESTFRLTPPTVASKRAATRRANAKAKEAPAAKTTKTTAKSSSTKRGPGRPKGSKNKK